MLSRSALNCDFYSVSKKKQLQMKKTHFLDILKNIFYEYHLYAF